MRNFRKLALAALVLICSGAGRAAAANLIINGSFENTAGTFVPDGNNAMALTPGSTAIPGWTTFSAELAWIGPANPFGVVASNGNFSLDFTGYHDTSPYGGVQQSVASTVGDRYTLQFDIGTLANGQTSSVTVSAGSSSAPFSSTNTNGGSQQWQTESFDFVATGASTLISFLGTQASQNGTYIGLDNVVLTDLGPATVPEPCSLTLLACGGVSALGWHWRRRKQI